MSFYNIKRKMLSDNNCKPIYEVCFKTVDKQNHKLLQKEIAKLESKNLKGQFVYEFKTDFLDGTYEYYFITPSKEEAHKIFNLFVKLRTSKKWSLNTCYINSTLGNIILKPIFDI